MTEVLWITPSYPWPGQPVGGIFHRTQARAVARRGVMVTVAAPVPLSPWPLSAMQGRWSAYARAPRSEDDAGIRVIRPRYPNVPGQPAWSRPDHMIARSVWRSRDQWAGATLVHGHAAVEGLATGRLAGRAGLPYVLTFHGSDINTWPATHPGRLDDLKATVRGAAAVLAVSGSLAARVRDMTGVDAQALPLGCDHRALWARHMDRAEARHRLALPQDAIVALFVGHLVPAKGVHEFVEGVLAAGDPLLGVLVGGGREHGFGLAEPKGATHLRYTGELPHDLVVQYMSAADVIVLPSYGEGMPTVLVEAGSLGLPVIATAVGGIPELLGTDRGTLLPRPDAHDLADALRSFAAAPGAAGAAAARLRGHVLAEYDVDINAGRLLACYRAAGARLSSD